MANTHNVFIGMSCAFMNVDAYNLVGIANADIDNGLFLTLGAMSPAGDGAYEFTVTAGANADLIAGTAPQGYDIAAQVYDDPRYFTNKAGKPIGVKRLVKGDVIQVTIGSFTADPNFSTNKYAKVGEGGKLTAQSTNASADFQILGTEPIDIGGEAVTGYILMKLA